MIYSKGQLFVNFKDSKLTLDLKIQRYALFLHLIGNSSCQLLISKFVKIFAIVHEK